MEKRKQYVKIVEITVDEVSHEVNIRELKLHGRGLERRGHPLEVSSAIKHPKKKGCVHIRGFPELFPAIFHKTLASTLIPLIDQLIGQHYDAALPVESSVLVGLPC